jgi:hypothetical protein
MSFVPIVEIAGCDRLHAIPLLKLITLDLALTFLVSASHS